MTSIKVVLKSLIGSNFLGLKEFVYLNMVLRQSCKIIDFILSCGPQNFGNERFLQWKQSLLKGSWMNDSFDFNTINANEVDCLKSGQIGEINRDVVRTYQTHPFFKEGQLGRPMLQSILVAIVKSRPDVGYCQGMNFVVGALLLGRMPQAYLDSLNYELSPDEEIDMDEEQYKKKSTANANNSFALTDEFIVRVKKDVYGLMMELLNKQGKLAMSGLWAERVPKLKLRVYQLDRLVRWNFPRLHAHFNTMKLSPEVLTAQWFVTLFAYNLPLDMTLHIWDYLFEMGWEGVFKVAISLLGVLEPQLLALEDLEGFAMLMREWKRLGHLNIPISVHELLNRANKLVINQEVLLRLQEGFALEIVLLATYCYEEAKQASMNESKHGHSNNDHSSHGGTHSNASSNRNTPLFNSSGNNSPFGGSSNNNSNTVRKYPYDEAANYEEKIRLGEDVPTYWLQRYGQKLSLKAIEELLDFKIELKMLDQLVEVDKQQLHQKIVKACDYYRETQEELELSHIEYEKTERLIAELSEDIQIALQEAQNLAAVAAFLIEEVDSNSVDDNSVNNSSSPNNNNAANRYEAVSSTAGGSNNSNSNRQYDDVKVDVFKQESNKSTITNRNQQPNPGVSKNNSMTTHSKLTAVNQSLNALIRENGLIITTTTDSISSDSVTTNSSFSNKTSSIITETSESAARKSITGWASRRSNNNSSHSLTTLDQSNNNNNDTNSRNTKENSNNNKEMLNVTGIAIENDINGDNKNNNDTNSPIEEEGNNSGIPSHHLNDLLDIVRANSSDNKNDSSERIEKHDSTDEEDDIGEPSFVLLKQRKGMHHYNDGTDSDDEHDDLTMGYSEAMINARNQRLNAIAVDDDGEHSNKNNTNNNNAPRPHRLSWNTLNNLKLSVLSPNSSTNSHIKKQTTNSSQEFTNVTMHTTPSAHSFDSDITQPSKNSTPTDVPPATTGLRRWRPNGYVRRSIYNASVALANRISTALNSPNENTQADPSLRNREVSNQLKNLEKQSQISQQKIIDLHRSLDEAKRYLVQCKQRLEYAKTNDEEALQWKKSLCDQLQLLVEDSNRGRSQKLIFISDNYLI